MKTNIRIRRNSGSKSTPAQVPNKPEAASPEREAITLEFLTPNDECIDCCALSAAESESVRIFTRNAKVSLAEFTKDALLHRVAASIAAAKPSAPVAVDETPVVSYLALPPLQRENVIVEDKFDMESAVARTLALVELMAKQDCTITERMKSAHAGYAGMGMMILARDLNPRLQRDWLAANDALKKDKKIGAAGWPSIRKLGNTVEKVQAFLLMLAHDLSSFDYSLSDGVGFEPAADDIAPFLSLASDAVEYLKASFYAEYGRHLPMDEIDRGIWNELLAKFPQAEQQRRAA